MSSALGAATEALFQAAHGDFVNERKRLSAELKASGDKSAAAALAKLARPPISAWAVNQLWWQERALFDALLAAAAQVKRGDREAGKAHREALSELRAKAAELLGHAGNAASESTLRRITTTLSALAAIGSFEPDAPGALTSDRDPPGFETFVATSSSGSSAAAPPRSHEAASRSEAAKTAAAKKEAEAAERRAAEEERKRRSAERERLSAALRDAQRLKSEQQREVTRLQSELEGAEQGLKDAQTLVSELEAQLASL